MFEPQRCPYADCTAHTQPDPERFVAHGSYWPKCRSRPVPRFRCKACRRTFSRQTFRADYRDHRPHLNAALVQLLCSGLGQRLTARMLDLNRKSAVAKFKKLARHARHLDDNLARTPLARGAVGERLLVHMDEFESYEGRRNTRPVSIAVAIESETRFLFGARSAPIRPRGKMSEARRAAIEADEERLGRRPDRSQAATRWSLRRAHSVAPEAARVELWTDFKSTYPGLATAVFGEERLEHRREVSASPRTTSNPLFPINHTEACLRDWLGRLRRESWLVSKLRPFLNLHLRLYSAWRNWVQPRFNRDTRTPGQLLGLIRERLTPAQLLGWRQDWGAASPHPCGDGRRTVAA